MAYTPDISIKFVGPGSQPPEPDGVALEFAQLPADMATYRMPSLQLDEDIEHLRNAIVRARQLLSVVQQHKAGELAEPIDLTDLDSPERHFFDQLLGEGEVAVLCHNTINARIQESVLAGIWRVQYLDETNTITRDTIEVGSVPRLVSESAFQADRKLDIETIEFPENAYNAAPLITEIADKLENSTTNDKPHVINLSLLPHTQEDIEALSGILGVGSIVILSRGYGSCRISATATRNVWWVQYFNSQDTLILNTIEISRVPEVACAAAEDIADSANRLEEVLSVYGLSS